MPYLTVDIRHDPVFMTWCDANSIPLITGWTIAVYDETPVRVVLDVIDLDGEGEWVRDEDGVPVTHEVTYTATDLPRISGHMGRGNSTSP